MCSGCERVWSILHVLWSSIYVSSGAAQLVAGIFFLLALPSFILACNLLTGILNIFMGIGVGMVACCGQISPKRQEMLLYMTIIILTANTVNTLISEYGFYSEDLPKLLQKHQYHTLLRYASLTTRVAAAAAILVSFLDSQLTFCSMQTTTLSTKKKLRGSHEQVSDIEYIIPRAKAVTKPQVCNAYSQSWVFETEQNQNSNLKSESPYLKLPQDGTPMKSPIKKIELENGISNDTTYLIDNPMVHIEEASDDSNSNSDRKLCYMKSFSRSASPGVLSASSSQISLNQNSVPIYECLEKLTQPDTFRSRLNSALSSKEEPQYQTPQVMVRESARSTSPQVEQVQYASLMKELQKAIGPKKDSFSPPSNVDTQTNSKCSSRHDSSRSTDKNSDAEFSKELEAALQLIQDLESPNTIDTPSETKSCERDKPLVVWRNSSRSDSEKTLSAVGSLAEITSPLNETQQDLHTFKPPQPMNNGKSATILVNYSESQSTSGYSSPTHNKTHKSWSTTSSLNGSQDLKPLSYAIHNSKSTAVISLYGSDTLKSKAKSITLVNICGDNLPVENSLENVNTNISRSVITPSSDLIFPASCDKTYYSQNDSKSPSATCVANNGWNVKSLLRKKKQNLPRLCPELEGAIVKSESLAYLTELELLARHQRNKNIQRQIEQRVQQQLGTPWTETD